MVYAVVHLGQRGYLLTVLPACYLVVGRALVALWQRLQEVRMPAAWRGALAGLALAGALGAHVAFFTAAGPVDAPSPAAATSWRARVTSELRALYRFRLWSHTAAGPARARGGDRRLRGGHPARSSTRATPCS